MTTMTFMTARPFDAAGQAGPFGGLATLTRRLRQRAALRRRYVQTRAALDALNDADLVDVGIARYAIPDVARKAVYGA